MRALSLPLVAVLLLAVEATVTPYHAVGVGFTVDSTVDAVDAVPGDGACATEAGECTLRAAIQETNALPGPDEISLPAGTYELTIPGRAEDAAATGDLDITDDLTITGAGRDVTIIDGGQLDRIFHAFLFFHSQLQVNLSNLTIGNGSAELVPTIGETDNGGGVYLGAGVSATLTDIKVTNNSSTSHGGGIWIGDAGGSAPPSSVDMVRVEISGNSSGLDSGGGIFSRGIVTLTDSVVSSNSGGTGGGIYNGRTLALVSSRVASNDAGAMGGGAFNTGTSSFTMADSEFTGNVAGSAGGVSAAGTAVIAGSTISGNTASQEGGGLFVWGETTVTATTIAGNVAGTDGGAVYVWVTDGPGLELTNSTVSGNEAVRDGGGIFLLAGAVELTNATIAHNAADSGGAVALSDVAADHDARATNTIFSNNTPSNCTLPLTSLGHNLEDADTCDLTGQGDLTHADPLLSALGDYGGPTLTHALLEGSPATDTGATDGCPDRDQRGAPRPFDGDSVNGAACDIGAYEFGSQAPPPPPYLFGDVDCNGTVGAVDALSVLRHVAGFPPLAACLDVADVNCNGAIDAVDALWVLRYVAALPVESPNGCPSIGTLHD